MRSERKERRAKWRGELWLGLIFTLQPVIGFIYRLDSSVSKYATNMHPNNVCEWQAFLLTCTNFSVVCPCPHYPGRRYSPAGNEHGTMPFILTMGVTSSCMRDECSQLSVFNVNTTGDVKSTYLSGSGGRVVWEQPCCVMRLVTERKVRTSVILMCTNSSNNKPWQLVATDLKSH